jgi:hypothetical protein
MGFCGRCGTKVVGGFCESCGTPTGVTPQSYGGNSGQMGCYHHPSQQAVTHCRGCGKAICEDCFQTYGVSDGEYEGEALCYDCTCALVAENVTYFEHFKKRVKRSRVTMIVFAIIGLIMGFGSGIEWGVGEAFLYGGFGAAIGASLGTILGDVWLSFKVAVSMGWADKSMSSFGWGLVFGGVRALFMMFVSPIIAIYQFVKRTNQIKRAEKIIESDSHALQEMRDYYAYTQVMERNASTGIDLAAMASSGGELFNNSYANSVMQNGEQKAQAGLRQSVVSISENGEILRSFVPQKKKAA